MRKLFLWFLLLSLLLQAGCSKAAPKTYKDPYNPAAAVAYSYQYATTRNPDYANFQTNCTNYISQALVAGGKEMDAPIAPKKDVRITYHDQKDQWFSAYIETEPARWREFSVSTPFCRTPDFVRYWTRTRGMALNQYANNVSGLRELYRQAEPGDIIVLYNPKGEIVHLCLLAVKKELRLLVNANTNDYYERNIMEISPITYPRIGLLEME